MNTPDYPRLIRPDTNYNANGDEEHRTLHLTEADGDARVHVHHTSSGDAAVTVEQDGEEEVAITIDEDGVLSIKTQD